MRTSVKGYKRNFLGYKQPTGFDGFGLGVRKKYIRQVLLSGRFTSKTSDVIKTFLPGSTRAKFRIIPDKLIDLLSSKAVRGTVGIIYFKIFFFEFTSGHLVLGSTLRVN